MLRYICFLIIFLISSCSSLGKYFDNYDINFKVDTNLINDKNEVKPIEIKMPFFWMIRPWKEGKLVTIDGWGRYAEISFIGEKTLRLKHLVDFPRTTVDGWGFDTFPEAGIIASSVNDILQHIAAIDDNKTKSHIPLLTWRHKGPYTVLLDPNEGLFAYQYRLADSVTSTQTGISLFIYNYKTDTMIYETPDPFAESPQEYAIRMGNVRDGQLILSHRGRNTFFYDWKKGEITRNDVTEFLNQNNRTVFDNCVHLDRRYLFVEINNKLLKIDWDAGYSNVQVTDMSYLFQNVFMKRYSPSVSHIVISPDGSWVTTTITDFSDYNPIDFKKTYINTRVFFHIDNKYPNGISMPVFIDGNEHSENTKYDLGAFVEHPVYGMCYAQQWYSKGKTYLRLYKMDDVLTVINSDSESLPFNYDDSKNYLFTNVYTYDKNLIRGWIFEEKDTDIETNQFIDSIINYCEAEIVQVPVSEPDNKLSKIELYKDHRHSYHFLDKKTRVYLYINKANEDNNIYYIEIDFYILEHDYNPTDFELYKLIICNQYFKFSESDNDVPKTIFWQFYTSLEEGESAYKYFLNEIEKHRR